MEREGEGRKRRFFRKFCFLLTSCVMISVFLTACSGENANSDTLDAESITLTLAAFGSDADLYRQVEAFNETHSEYQIQVEEYMRSEISEEDGIARLQREIMTGKGPDIIDFGSGYSTCDIMGEYTENLFPYLKESAEGKQELFDNILASFSYQGKLYAMPVNFGLQTFAGSKKILGERDGWTMQEMIATYEAAPKGTMLYPGETKKDVFGTLLYGNLDYYVDWESGTCRFDSGEFAEMLAFANSFPENLQIEEDYSIKQTYNEGGALLYQMRLQDVYDICKGEMIFGEEVTYVGFPVAEGVGTVITGSNHMLGISVNSEHKEQAWEFISSFLTEEYQKTMSAGLPILRSALEEKLLDNREILYEEDDDGNAVPMVQDEIVFEGEDSIPVYHITEEQANRLLVLADNAVINNNTDLTLYGILLEEADGYFCGDKSLEETCEVMQGRAEVYIAEQS